MPDTLSDVSVSSSCEQHAQLSLRGAFTTHEIVFAILCAHDTLQSSSELSSGARLVRIKSSRNGQLCSLGSDIHAIVTTKGTCLGGISLSMVRHFFIDTL